MSNEFVFVDILNDMIKTMKDSLDRCMESEQWIYRDVDENGAVSTGGAVHTDFLVSNSIEDRCTSEGCKCRRCHWIAVNLGRQDDACVYGVSYYFETEEELFNFISNN